jgi:hypothetical protein
MKLTNLEDDEGKTEVIWSINLKPDCGILKSLRVVDPYDKCTSSFSTTYIVK